MRIGQNVESALFAARWSLFNREKDTYESSIKIVVYLVDFQHSMGPMQIRFINENQTKIQKFNII